MRGALVRKMRQEADRARGQAIGAVSGAVTAAFTNEELTRKRVEAIEQRISELEAKISRGFLGWLRRRIFGK